MRGAAIDYIKVWEKKFNVGLDLKYFPPNKQKRICLKAKRTAITK